MANTRRFEIEVLGDTSKAQRAMRDLEGAGSKHLAGLKRYADAVVGGIAFNKIADGISSVIDAARESEKVMKTTEAIIKATGGAAKMSADDVSKLATAISNKTGLDDEQIQSGENLLLTFKAVHNEVGKGNDVFNRATQAMVDMAAAGYGTVEGNAVQLGKALQDPIKGVSALGRAGITFSEDQKKMIKSLVDTGDTLGAQKIILKEVEGQVKGTAEAQATAADKMRQRWENLKETIGEKLLPIADKFAQWMTDKALPAIEQMVDWTDKHLVPALQSFAKWTDEHVVPALKKAWEWINDKLLPVFVNLGGWILEKWPAISSAFQASIKTIGDVINGLVKIGQGIVTFFQGVWKGDLDKVWDGVKTSVGTIWAGIKTTAENIGPEIGTAVKKWGPVILEKLTDALKTAFIELPAKLAASLAKLGLEIGKKIASGIGNSIKDAVGDALDKLNPFKNMSSSGPDYSLTGGLDTGPSISGADVSYARQPASTNNALAALVAAIKKQETGFLAAQGKNQYTASGPMTRYGIATGAYQFLDSTWRAWGGSTRRAKDASASEQDAVATRAIQSYMQRYGGDPELVAIAWHAGPGAADAVKAGRRSASSFVDSAAHTNSGAYATNVAKYYRGYLGGGAVGAGPINDEQVVIGAKSLDKLADIAGSLDLEAAALADLRSAGYSENEAADRWRWAMLASNRDDAAAYRSIEAALASVEDATVGVGDSLSDALDGMSMSIEDYAASFFEGVKALYTDGNFSQQAFSDAMARSLTDGTSTTSPEGVQIRLYARDPSTGGTLFDANGNPIYADDVAAVQRRLAELGYGGPNTPGPSFPGGGPPINSTQTINVVVDGKVLASATVGALRAQGAIRPDGTLQATR